MAVIEHREYKVICDNCGSDVTTWEAFKNRTQAIEVARRRSNKALIRGRQFCQDCEGIEISERQRKYDEKEMKRKIAILKYN